MNITTSTLRIDQTSASTSALSSSADNVTVSSLEMNISTSSAPEDQTSSSESSRFNTVYATASSSLPTDDKEVPKGDLENSSAVLSGKSIKASYALYEFKIWYN